MPILAGFLFGIIQYGYGLFQYQAFSSAISDTTDIVSSGVSSCAILNQDVGRLIENNGLTVDQDHPARVSVKWLDLMGNESIAPVRLGYAEVTGIYESPLNFNVPLLPFPDDFTITRRVVVQNLATNLTDNLLACTKVVGA